MSTDLCFLVLKVEGDSFCSLQWHTVIKYKINVHFIQIGTPAEDRIRSQCSKEKYFYHIETIGMRNGITIQICHNEKKKETAAM